MTDRQRVTATMPALTVFMLAACAPKTPPHPPVDPFKEQFSVLQKQLLELQNNQNDTRKNVDEQSAAVQTLSTKVKTLEEQHSGSLAGAFDHLETDSHGAYRSGEENGKKEEQARS